MARRTQKKTQRRRRMRGGAWYNPFSWFTPATAPPAQIADAAAPIVDSTVGTPAEQAKALDVAPAPPSAAAGDFGGGKRKRRHTRRR
jgi:hypothetical protein